MKTNTLLAFIGGALVGAAAALLLAPDSGENTRKKIKDAVKSEVDDLEEKMKSKIEDIEEKFTAKTKKKTANAE